MNKNVRFVKLSDMIGQISRQSYFTAFRLSKMYEDCMDGHQAVNNIKIDRKIPESGASAVKKYKKLIEEKDGQLFIKENVAKLIEDYFYQVWNNDMKNLVDEEFDESIKREGLLNIAEWRKLFGENMGDENDNPITTFIPQVHISELDLYIALKESGGRIKILQNPQIENSMDDGQDEYNPSITLQRLKIKILRKIKNSSKLESFNLTYQKAYKCSRCSKLHYLYPHQSNQTLKCHCIVKVDGKGNEIRQAHTTLKEGLFNIEYPIYLYEIGIGWNSKQLTSYMYSIEKLDKGKYFSDILTLNLEVEGKSGTIPIIMGSIKKNKIKMDETLFTKVESDVEEESMVLKVPKIKILNVLYAVRDLVQRYGYIKVNNKGYLLQLFTTISAIAKHRYGFNKLAISVIGNSGLSKTYSAEILVKMLDNDGIIVGNGKNLTYSGIIGGVNMGGISVGGNKISVFEEGIATAGGLVLLDEANVYYSDPEINSSLKNLLDGSIRIAKTGAPKEEIPNNYTPLILCNFPIAHKKMYMDKIKENYKKLLRKYPHNLHEMDEKSIEKYLSEQDFYLPLKYYVDELKNTTLARTISYVRKVYFTNPQMEIDWRTGGSIPSANRILFDVVCNNRSERREIEREIPQNPVIPDKDDLPTEEFVEILKNWRKKYNINLMDRSKNTKEVNDRIRKIEQSIYTFLTSDKRGDKIYTAMAWGDKNKNIDNRLEGEMYILGLVLQLFENEESEELSENVKQWMYLLLTKCKRGILEEEYNFMKHYWDIENIEYDISEIELMVKEVDEEEKLEKEARVEILKEKSEKNNNFDILDDLDNDLEQIK